MEELSELYEQGQQFIQSVMDHKYVIKDEKSYEDVRDRHLKFFSDKKKSDEFIDTYERLHKEKKLIPAGSITYGLGNDTVKSSLSNCYLEPILNDSIEAIFDFLKRAARTYSFRGGVGTDITVLRPRNCPVNNAAVTSTGSVSFMPLISETTQVIGQCIEENQRVLTKRGMVPIKDVVPNQDHVWTKKGWVQVIDKFNNGEKYIYEVELKSGLKIQTSEDHVFSKGVGESALKDVPVGDSLNIIPCVSDFGSYQKLNQQEYKVNDYNKSNRLNVNVSLPEIFNEDLAYFIGFSYGDGCVGYQKNGEISNISLACGDKYPEIKDQLRKVAKQVFNIEMTTRSGDGALERLDVSSRIILEFLNGNGILKQKSEDIKIPEILYKSPSSVINAFIAGYFDADGYDSNGKKGFAFSSVSHEFLQELQKLLLAVGIPSRINREDRSNKGWRTLYTLSVLGHYSQRIFFENVGKYSQKKLSRVVKTDSWLTPYTSKKQLGIKEYIPFASSTFSYNSYMKLRESYGLDYALLKDEVVSIEKVGESNTFDIKLDQEHLFWCEGFYVHNSGRRGASLISEDIRHPDIPLFIKSKAHPEEVFGKDPISGKIQDVTGANISVKITDKFMKAVEEDKDWTFIFPDTNFEKYNSEWDGDYDKWLDKKYPVIEYDTVKARDIMEMIAESAWSDGCPGVMFIDVMRKYSTGLFDEKLMISGTNPCFTGNMKLLTSDGYKTFKSLSGKDIEIINAEGQKSLGKVWTNGVKKVVEIKFRNPDVDSIICTPDHRFMLQNGDECEAKDLKGKRINHPFNIKKDWNVDDFMAGFIQGDGQTGRLRDSAHKGLEINIGNKDEDVANFLSINYSKDKKKYREKRFYDIAERYNLDPNPLPERNLPKVNITADFLAGLWSANGSVIKGHRVAFKTANKNLAEDLLNILVNDYEIECYITTNKSKKIRWKNGEYLSKESYDLNINRFRSVVKFAENISFVQKYKQKDLSDLIIKKTPSVSSVKEAGESEVFDFHEPNTHWGIVEGFQAHNCGEQSMAYHNNCMLSSLALHKYIKNPWTDSAEFDFNEFINDVRFNGEMMDVLIDENIQRHPLKEQREADAYSRRVGGELTGIADAAAMLGWRYTSVEAKKFYGEIAKVKAQNEFIISLELAERLGTCPALKTVYSREEFIKQPYVKRILNSFDINTKKSIKERLIKSGLRNTNWGSYGPTGTISIIADNCSSGIEPVFNTEYTRKSKLKGMEETRIIHFPILKHCYENDIDLLSMSTEEVKERFNYEVSHEVDYNDRIEIQSIFQEWCDTSISSTVNMPFTSSIENVHDIYMKSWRSKLKGVTIFRDGSKTGVLSTESLQQAQEKTKVEKLSRELLKKHFELSKSYLHKDQNAKRIIEYWKGVKVYVTVTLDESNNPIEIFTKLPNEAGFDDKGNYDQDLHNERVGQFDAICRLTSLLLRTQAPHEEIIKQLERSSFSMFDIAGTIVRVLNKFDFLTEGEKQRMYECPECKEEAVVKESGCDKCTACGYSKCG